MDNQIDDVFKIEFNYDLSMQLMDKYFPGGSANRKAAYDEIGRYFHKMGYKHVLYSTYASNVVYQEKDIPFLVNHFFDSIKWAENCMKNCHITIINDSIIDALEMRNDIKDLKRESLIDYSIKFNSNTKLDDKIKYYKQKIDKHKQLIKECEEQIIELEKLR